MNVRSRFPAPSVFLLLLGFAAVVAACTVPAESDVPAADAPAELGEERLAAGYNDLGFDVLRMLMARHPEDNVVLSGASLAAALAMVYDGADGATRDEIGRVLRVDSLDADTFRRAHRRWLEAMQADAPGTELAMANALWARLGFPFEEAFLQRMETEHYARAAQVDFDDPAAVGAINGWVAEETRQRIPTIVDQLNPDDVMLLVNAVYFLGEWTTPFSETGTSLRPFRLPDGSTAMVPTMVRRGMMDYAAGDGYEALRLPYGDDERFAMYIVLPRDEKAAAVLYDELNASVWAAGLDRLQPTDIELQLPRFTVEDRHGLRPVLEQLGMVRAFDPRQADFSPMTRARDDVHISSVVQKTFIQVNETGTEAAAVTAITVGVTSLPSHTIVRVDRPFLFAIQDDATGTILFVGRIARPEDSKPED